jgi:signal transduction histidine kinase
LNDIFLITNKLKNINLENIKKFDIELEENDEIYEIIASINKFLDLIDENTKNLKEFNTNVSHEFKTPLMIISTQLEYAIKTKKYDESFEKIEKQIDFLNELLETFLFVSKIQNSKINIKSEKINITNLITNLLDEIEKIYLSKQIKLVKNIDRNIFLETDEKLFFFGCKKFN